MPVDLSGYDRPEHRGCLTARQVARHALAYLCTDNRALVAHLLQQASDLMAAAHVLAQLFLHDGWDTTSAPTADTGSSGPAGLTEVQRLGLLTLASTCAHNAALFLQEAQHRRVHRAGSGWDPITNPYTD